MKKLSGIPILRTAMFTSMVLLATSVSATPILMESAGSQHVRLSGGQQQVATFRGDNDTVVTGHYTTGPWKKSELLRLWANNGIGGIGGSGANDLPVIQVVSSLPEPSTGVLLALGLLAMGFFTRRPTNR